MATAALVRPFYLVHKEDRLLGLFVRARARLGAAAAAGRSGRVLHVVLRVLLVGNGDHHGVTVAGGGLVSPRMQASFVNKIYTAEMECRGLGVARGVRLRDRRGPRLKRTWRLRAFCPASPSLCRDDDDEEQPTLRGLFALSDVGEGERERNSRTLGRQASKEGAAVWERVKAASPSLVVQGASVPRVQDGVSASRFPRRNLSRSLEYYECACV